MKPVKTFFVPLIMAVLFALSSGCAHAKIATVSYKSKQYVPFQKVAAYYSMERSYPTSKKVRLKNRWHTLEYEANGTKCWVDGTLIYLNHGITKLKSGWCIDSKDYDNLIDPALRPYAFLSKQGTRVVVLDPGHGGKDMGAKGKRNVQEKLLVLDVSKRIKKHLNAKGITVKMTRDGDSTLTLAQRSQKAKSFKGDIFVSLHADSASASANGVGSFILARPGCYSTHSYGKGKPSTTYNAGNKYNVANAVLGYRIQQNLVRATKRVDRGVKHARFQVLRDAPCPAALIEMGFLSNASEEALFIQSSYREKLAQAISSGILAYFSDVRQAKAK